MNGNQMKYHTRCGRLFDLNNNNNDKQQKKKNFVHLNHRPKTKIFKRYEESASKMDGKKSKKINTSTAVHSTSGFKGKRSKVDDPIVLKQQAMKDMIPEELKPFLGWHYDTHKLPTFLIAYSYLSAFVSSPFWFTPSHGPVVLSFFTLFFFQNALIVDKHNE